MELTADQRNELVWAKNAKMVRLGFYDVGIVLGAILLADKAHMITEMMSKSGFSVEDGAVLFALALWLGMIFQRYRDWHSVDRLEKGLDREELERKFGRTLSEKELKNFGLN
jgi:hypothetical protein